MKIGHASTYAMGANLRALITQGQAELTRASYETTTGHVYQPGVALGHKTVNFIGTEERIKFLQGLQGTNNLALIRAETAQIAIKNLVGEGKDRDGVLNEFNKVLLGDTLTSTPEAIQRTAQSTLHSFVSALNSNYNGEYVFAGVNTSVAPFQHYEAGTGEGASGVVLQAFKDYFGFDTKDPKVAAIKPDEMEAFINDPLGELFEEPSWGQNFCTATDELVRNRISPDGEVVDIAVSANDKAFRHMMKNLVMIAEFGNIGLDGKTQSAVSDAARIGTDGKATGRAITEIILCSARLGTSRAQIKNANERIDVQLTVLNESRNELIGVDKAEAAFRANQILNMLNESYQLTAKISHLSLMNYL